MSLLKIDNVNIEGLSACVPSKILRTQDYEILSEKEKKYFTIGTGIKERRVANSKTCASDLCYKAAENLIQEMEINKDSIDVLIFVSQSPDYFLPATSVLLQNRLNLSNSCMAFDIMLGCSGYVYGLSVISSLLSNSNLKTGLLLCGDKSTLSTNYKDKSTYPLFGDAGSATLLKQDKSAHPMYFNLQSDGSGEEAIIIREGASRNPYNENTLQLTSFSEGISRRGNDLELNGVDIFNFALKEVQPNINKLLEFASFNKENIDYLVMHQANKLINENVRKKLKIDSDKTPYSIDRFGNTSSASIPLTIISELNNSLSSRNTLLLSGFGVGLSWGSALISVENPHIANLIEY